MLLFFSQYISFSTFCHYISHCNTTQIIIFNNYQLYINVFNTMKFKIHMWNSLVDFFIESNYKDLSCPLKNSALLTLSLTAILTLAVLSVTWDPQITLLGLQVPLLLPLYCWEWVKLILTAIETKHWIFALDYLYPLTIEKMDPVGPLRNMRLPLRIATVVGAFGGFLYAYQTSSRKFLICISGCRVSTDLVVQFVSGVGLRIPPRLLKIKLN